MFPSREIDTITKLCKNDTKWYSPYYVTKTSANSSAIYWSRDTRDNDTVLYQFLDTGTSDRCLINIVQRLKLPPFIFPLQSL